MDEKPAIAESQGGEASRPKTEFVSPQMTPPPFRPELMMPFGENQITPVIVGPPGNSPIGSIEPPDLRKVMATKTNCEQLFWSFMIVIALDIAGALCPAKRLDVAGALYPSVRTFVWAIGGTFAFAIEVSAVVYIVGRYRWFWLQPRGVRIRGMIGAIGGLLLLLFSIIAMFVGSPVYFSRAKNTDSQTATPPVVTGALDSSEHKTVHNSRYGFTIKVPGNWTIRENEGNLMEDTAKALVSFSDPSEPYMTARVSVRKLKTTAAPNISDLEEFARMDASTKVPGQPDFRVNHLDRTTLDDRAAVVADLTMPGSDSRRFLLFYVCGRGSLFFVTVGSVAADFDQQRNHLERIVGTFHIDVDPAADERAGLLKNGVEHETKGDYVEAAKCFRKAAEMGDAQGMSNLGYLLEHGLGVSKDEAEALKWIGRAAEANDPAAMLNLAFAYEQGMATAKDDSAAVTWFRKAAETGLPVAPVAMNRLGMNYAAGRGVTKDLAEAVTWYRKGADLGDRDAMANLAACYSDGSGVKKDHVEALNWFDKAGWQLIAREKDHFSIWIPSDWAVDEAALARVTLPSVKPVLAAAAEGKLKEGIRCMIWASYLFAIDGFVENQVEQTKAQGGTEVLGSGKLTIDGRLFGWWHATVPSGSIRESQWTLITLYNGKYLSTTFVCAPSRFEESRQRFDDVLKGIRFDQTETNDAAEQRFLEEAEKFGAADDKLAAQMDDVSNRLNRAEIKSDEAARKTDEIASQYDAKWSTFTDIHLNKESPHQKIHDLFTEYCQVRRDLLKTVAEGLRTQKPEYAKKGTELGYQLEGISSQLMTELNAMRSQ